MNLDEPHPAFDAGKRGDSNGRKGPSAFNLPLCFDVLLSLLIDLLVMDLVLVPTLTVKPITSHETVLLPLRGLTLLFRRRGVLLSNVDSGGMRRGGVVPLFEADHRGGRELSSIRKRGPIFSRKPHVLTGFFTI